ncbi:MAG: YbaK/EbsC family protein [Actinobacteria bacterium]|nr:YbaK/EbsC family protein [Actinomycetota bacterium]
MPYVIDYLQGRGAEFTVIPHPHTPEADGDAPHVPDERLAKTHVIIANFGPGLVVIPASRALEMDLVAQAVGDDQARLATDDELDRLFPEYERGALPPLAMMLLVPVFVDPAVAEREEVEFAAGRQDLSIRMATHDMFGSDPIVVGSLTRESRAESASS